MTPIVQISARIADSVHAEATSAIAFRSGVDLLEAGRAIPAQPPKSPAAFRPKSPAAFRPKSAAKLWQFSSRLRPPQWGRSRYLLSLTFSLFVTWHVGEPLASAQPQGDSPALEEAQAVTEDEKKTLRFNFRRQPWEDVLEWLADEADLSLVLDAPPPGSFSYTDARSYDVVEAIDLVNGVLASKGFTLLRRERMLTLINLEDAIPRMLVPRVSLEEVSERGQYDFVTVAIPLSGRNPESTLAEIQPLLSAYGDASALPASGQLLVTDSARVIRLVAGLVESMPTPKSASAPTPTKDTPREFRAYSLDGGDGAAAVNLLESVLDARFAHDPSGDLINAYATADQHLIVQQLMEQVRNTASKRERRLEIYPIEGLTSDRQSQLVADLQAVTTGAVLRFDAVNQQVVVWGDEEQHLEIRRALLTLVAAGSASSQQTAQVYQLVNAQADEVVAILQTALPRASIKRVGSSDRLLAIAAPDEQRLLSELLEQLDQPASRPPRIIKEYALQRDPPEGLSELIADAAPDANVRIDAARRTIAVTARLEDQQTIATLIQSVEENLLPREEQALSVYVLSEVQQERFADARTLVEQTAPQARLTWREETGELFAWAGPEDQQAIARLLDSLDAAEPRVESEVFRAYPAATGQVDAIVELVQKVAPNAATAVDRSGRRLLVWADREDHEKIEPILAPAEGTRASATDLGFDADNYRAYPAPGIDISLAVQLLAEVFPAADFQPDLSAGSIIVRAASDEHSEIEAMLEQLVEGSTAVRRQKVTVYPLGDIALSQAEGLRSLFPSMRMSLDAATHQLTAWGSGEDHHELLNALESLGGGRTNKQWNVKSFTLQKARAAEIAPALERLLPNLTVAAISNSELLVRGSTDSFDQVADLVKQLDHRRTRAANQRAHAIPIKYADPSSLLATLAAVFPPSEEAFFSYDSQTRALTAVLDADQLPLVEEVVRAADRQGHEDSTVQVHPLTGIDAAAALATLQPLFRERGGDPLLSTDAAQNRLIVVAEPRDQQFVADVLRSLRPQETNLEVFHLQTMDPYAAEIAIGQLFRPNSLEGGPPVTVEADEDGGRILVRATPEQLSEIRALLLKLGEINLVSAAANAGRTRFIPWRVDNVDQTLREIEAAWPSIRSNKLRRGSPPTIPRNGDEESPAQSDSTDRAAPPSSLPPGQDDSPEASSDEAAPDRETTSAPDDSASGEPPPVFMAPSSAGVAIASEDPAALNQLSDLIRAYNREGNASSGDVGVYPLRHASAERIAQLLKSVYARGSGYSNRIRFGSDDRINAVVALGGRAERREVEALLEILDTEQATDFPRQTQPVILPLQHASAEQVHRQLRTLYEAELQRNSNQPPLEIPPGASPEAVATLQQINAARQSPLLSLEVDKESNSLLVLAPQSMLEEIRRFVAQVDQASIESRVGVRVIQLEAIDGEGLLRSLEDIVIERP